MSQKPTISLADSAAFLQSYFGGEISQLTALSGGEWSQAFTFIHESTQYVLRWSNSADGFDMDARAAAFNSATLPIPQIVAVGSHAGKSYAISTFAEGQFLELLNADELEKTVPAILNLFDSLQHIDISQSTGYGSWEIDGNGSFNSWKEYLLDVKNDHEENITHGWQANVQQSEMGTKLFDQLYSHFEKLVDYCPESRELIHSDLLNKNLMVKNSKISGVIDWQCSLYGDGLYDIAWFVYYAPWYPQFEKVQLCEKILDHYKSTSPNSANVEERLLCYQLHIGLGSIAYNAFKKDWSAAQEAAEYTLKVCA